MRLEDIKPFTILPYMGGKSRVSYLRAILDSSPESFRDYREPFCGGASVAFAVKSWRPKTKLWLNDLNEDLMEVFLALRDRPNEFIGMIEELPARNHSELKEVFDSLIYDEKADQALRYYVISKCAMNGRVIYDRLGESGFYPPNGFSGFNLNRLWRAAELLKGSRLSCEDYSVVIDDVRADTWIFADPPYVRNSYASPRERLYKHNFEEADHFHLAAQIRRVSPHISITYDDRDLVRHLYRPSEGFCITPIRLPYQGFTTRHGMRKPIKKELLISNCRPNNRDGKQKAKGILRR